MPNKQYWPPIATWQDDWTKVGDPGAPSFGAGWSNDSLPLKYCRDSYGIVRFTGRIQYGGAGGGSGVFNLPAGFRPKNTGSGELMWPALFYDGTNWSTCRLAVKEDGGVYVRLMAGLATDPGAAMTRLHTDVVSFRAEQ